MCCIDLILEIKALRKGVLFDLGKTGCGMRGGGGLRPQFYMGVYCLGVKRKLWGKKLLNRGCRGFTGIIGVVGKVAAFGRRFIWGWTVWG